MSAKSLDSLQNLIDAVSTSAVMNTPALQQGDFYKAGNTQRAEYLMGKTAVTFLFRLQKQLKAIKIWPGVTNEELRQRYAITEKYFNREEYSYFVTSNYLKEGVNLNGVNYDALVMDWAGQQTLKEYIYANIDQKEKINALAEKILLMHKALNQEFIAHRRLHAGNIYIDANDKIKLIGYDSVFILGEMGLNHFESPYPDYAHPSGLLKGLKADFFAALILYLGCKAIAQDNVLWGRYKVGFQEGFLFNASDFKDIRNAAIYKYLRKTQSQEISRLLDILVLYCESKNATSLSPFYTYLEKASTLNGTAVTVIKNFVTKQPGTNSDNTFFNLPADKPLANNETINKPNPFTIKAEKEVPLKIKDLQENDATSIKPFFDIPSETVHVAKPAVGKTKKEVKSKASASNRKKFLAGGVLLCLGIIATTYLLTNRSEKIISPSFEIEKNAQKNLDIAAKEAQSKKEQQVTNEIKNSSTADSAINNKQDESLAESQPVIPPPSQEVADTVNTVKQDISTNKASAIEVKNSQVRPTDDKNNASRLLIDNATTTLPSEKKPAAPTENPPQINTTQIPARSTAMRKTRIKKADASKKQNSASFIIGTPPKK